MGCDHSCCCACEQLSRRAKFYWAEREQLQPEVGQLKQESSYAWYPRRCPLTKRWFWLSNIITTKKSEIEDGGPHFWWVPGIVWRVVAIGRAE